MSFQVSTEKKSGWPQLWRRQKWWLLLVCILAVCQPSHAQDAFPALTAKIAYTARQVTATKLFDELQKQSGYSFLFDRTAFNGLQLGDLNYTGKQLGIILTELQKKHGLLFSVAGKNVAVKQGPKPVRGTGKVAGKIIDEENSQPVFGATVRFGSEGTVSDVEGRFSISLEEGEHTAQVSYIGYGAKEISEVIVKPGEAFELNIILKRAKGTLAGVVVKGSAQKESAAALLTKQRNSTAITDGISAELIRRTPDRNAGDAIKRVTGVSVLEGKYVVVRGLADRYNYSMLNGGVLPSTEPDRRSFSLDLIPSLVIESIVVHKTSTADLPGEFAGGVVQVTTKDFPEQDFISVSLGSGFYESQTGKPFFKDVNGKSDWWGTDDGTRKIAPSLDKPAAEFIRMSPETRFRISEDLSHYWDPVQDGNAQPIQNIQLGYGKTIGFKDDSKLGIIALGNYRRDQTINEGQRYDLAQYFKWSGGTLAPGDSLRYMRSYPEEISYRYAINRGAMLNIAYQFGKHKVSLKSMYNRDFETITTLKSGEKTLGNGWSDIVDAKGVDMHPTQKTLVGMQLQGEHRLGLDNKAKLAWNIAYNMVKKYEPNQTRLGYINVYRADTVNNKDKNYFTPDFGQIESGSKLYTNLKEDAYNLDFTATVPFKVGEQPQLLKTGAFAQYRKRDYRTRNLGYFDAARGVTPPPNDNGGFYSPIDIDRNQPIDKILIPENFRPGGQVVVTYELPANEYTGGANLASAFVNMESNIVKQLRVIYGARVEFYATSLSTNRKLVQALPGSGGETQPPMDYIRYDTDVLPSASLIYNPIPAINVRAAWSKTLTRPEFREISPYQYFDFVSGYTTIGNPELKKGTIKNLDFRVEWFPAAGEIISASVFKKDLKDPVELATFSTTTTGRYNRVYKNVDAAEIRGIEFEVRKSLYFGAGPEWLRNIILFGNYSRIHSVIKGKVEGWEGRPEVDQYVKERPLMGQSPYLFNGGILVNALDNTFSFSAALNRVGRRIVIVGTTSDDRTDWASYPDIYENPRNQLDMQVSQKFFKQKLELRINAANLLNDAFIQYQDFDLNGKYSGNTFDATVLRRESYRQFTFTLSYVFKK